MSSDRATRFRGRPQRKMIAVGAIATLGVAIWAGGSGAAAAGLPTTEVLSVEGDVDSDGIPDFDPAGQPYDFERMEATNVADDVDREFGASPQYGGFEVSDDNEVTIYWRASTPDEVPEAVRRLSQSGAITLISSKTVVTKAELRAARDTILRAHNDVSISIEPGGLVLSAPKGDSLVGAQRTSLAESLGVRVPILRVEEGGAMPILHTSLREADTGSLEGGALIYAGAGSQFL